MNLSRHTINAFLKVLQQVDAKRVSDHPYCIEYFNQIRKNGKYFLTIYHRVLDTVIKRCNRPTDQIRLIDYGCGNGVLGLYARFCGFQQVWLADHDAEFAAAAKRLSELLDLSVEVKRANIEQLHPERADALVATDVIEHMYRLPDFFQSLQKINPEMVTVFTTASNPENPWVVKKIKSLQWKDEHEGNTGRGLSGDAHPPYRSMRAAFIKQYINHPEDIEALVYATRGLIHEDILKAIHDFLQDKTLSTPAPESNTCHPETGSWTERIYTPHELQAAFAAGGFTCNIVPGFYNEFGNGAKSVLKKCLNRLIPIFGKKIAPWIMITGFKHDSKS